MLKKSLLLLAVVASALPAIAFAEDATAPAAAASAPEASPLSFNIGVVSEYRYRGISQSRFKPALQGGADYAFASGFYVGTWASTIKWIKDAGTINSVDTGNTNFEWDFYGGYKGEIVKDVTYDVGLLEYFYAGNKYDNIPAGAYPAGKNANTLEIYGAVTYGPATLKYSHALTNIFGFGDSKNSGYIDASATFDVGAGVSLAPHVGYQRIAGANSDFSYTYYSLTASKDAWGFTFSLAAIGTSTKDIAGAPGSYAYFSPEGKNLGRATVVLGVKKTF